MKVLKFGGTSVGSAERIKNVAKLVCDGTPKLVVLSAMSGTTNELAGISACLYGNDLFGALERINELEIKYREVVKELYTTGVCRRSARSYVNGCFRAVRSLVGPGFTASDEKVVLAQGELIVTMLMKLYLEETGITSALLPAVDFMRTDKDGEPDVRYIGRNVKKTLKRHKNAQIYITQGYICRNAAGEIDNLRRGGSDYSASLIGAALGAEEIQIWTDIDGLHNNDPRIVKNTSPVRLLTFEEASKLAYFGAKILHPACIMPAKLKHIPVRLLNTMQPGAPGTLISDTAEKGKIKAVAAKDGVIYLKIKSAYTLPAYKFLNKVFHIFARLRMPVDLVATSEVGISLSVDDKQRLPEIVAALERYASVTVEKDMVIVCVVGDLEWYNIGFEAKIVDALKDIPVRMIAYGDSNDISLVIRRGDKKRALEALNTYVFA